MPVCLQKVSYDYTKGKRLIQGKVAASCHMPESLHRRLSAAAVEFGVDRVVIMRRAIDEHLQEVGF